MFTKSILLALTCVLLTALVTNCEEEENKEDAKQKEQRELEETFERADEESRNEAKRKRIETQRKRAALAKDSEAEEEIRNIELRELPETAAKTRDKDKEENESSGTRHDFVNSHEDEYEQKVLRGNENNKEEIEELKERKTKKRGEIEVKEKREEGEEEEEEEEKDTRDEMERRPERMEEEPVEKVRKEKMARRREFEEREDGEISSLSKRRFPKWMNTIANQFPNYHHQVACALKEMQAAHRAMKRLKARNCDRYFRCRGSRDVVTKCGYYSIAVAVKVSYTKQWRTEGADTGYDSGPDKFGRKRGDCVQKYIYDTTLTTKPCYLPYRFF